MLHLSITKEKLKFKWVQPFITLLGNWEQKGEVSCSSCLWKTNSVTSLGDFWNVLVANSHKILAKMSDDLIGFFKCVSKWLKNCSGYFWKQILGYFVFHHLVTHVRATMLVKSWPTATQKMKRGGSPGLVVMGGDSCSNWSWVRIPASYLYWVDFLLICVVKIVMMLAWKVRK